MIQVMFGAIAMASVVAGLFFVRFWQATRDRFFIFLALSFLVEGINRSLLGVLTDQKEGSPVFSLIRLASYLLIITAIVDKNRRHG
ncbi:MAG TPA: DUF5985 family protein [Verrucomicrobiae bacterium]|nr:DUF5985 family protein [Verrucomicrobiae bacterium]